MNRAEFSRLADAIRSYYPKEKIMPTKESMELWYAELKDLDYGLAVASVRKHANSSKWSPSIAEIREQSVDIQADDTDWGDGWQEVLTAVRRFGQYDKQGAMESMSGMTREIVERLGWKQICQSEQDELMAIRANFRMLFEKKTDKARKDAALPADLREQIELAFKKTVKEIE